MQHSLIFTEGIEKYIKFDDLDGDKVGGDDIHPINSIFPIKNEEAKPNHTYEFGDKVKVEGYNHPQSFICLVGDNLCLIANEGERTTIQTGEFEFIGRTVNLARVSLWVDPVNTWKPKEGGGLRQEE